MGPRSTPGSTVAGSIPPRGRASWSDVWHASCIRCPYRGTSGVAPGTEGSGTMRGNSLYSIIGLIVIVILILILLRVVGLF